MILPIRTKNPPERVPYVTFVLIGLNLAVYAFTSNGLEVTDAALAKFALTRANLSFGTVLSSMFLHGDVFHILGNMWFLWLLGAAVEGRLGHIKFTLLYLASGLTGDALDLLVSAGRADVPSLGASGAIMGLLGAALWMFPFSRMVVFYWFGLIYHGTWLWRMWGVALYYLGFDLVEGLVFAGADGVGHFAHLGGAIGGFLVALMFRAPRDNQIVSDAKSELADVSDLRLLSRMDLAEFAKAQPDDPHVALAWMSRCFETNVPPPPDCEAHFRKHLTRIVREGDPGQTGAAVLALSTRPGAVPAAVLAETAALQEKAGQPQVAATLLDRALRAPDCTDSVAEGALYRASLIQEAWFQNYAGALQGFEEFVRRWPMSPMAPQAAERARVLRTRVGT